MPANQRDDVSDLDVLQAVAEAGDPIASTAEICDQLAIENSEALDRLKRLSRNGLIAARYGHEERNWRMKMPGHITLEREG